MVRNYNFRLKKNANEFLPKKTSVDLTPTGSPWGASLCIEKSSSGLQ